MTTTAGWTVPTTPDWGPLEKVMPTMDDCAPWMHMGVVTHDGLTIQQYKHRNTRRYLNLDADGNAYQIVYCDNEWTPWDDVEAPTLEPEVTRIDLAAALASALS